MSALQMAVLGPVQVQLNERLLRFATRKEVALLVYLTLEGNQASRRQMIQLLWPESEARQARSSLRATLHRLREALGEAGPPNKEALLHLEADTLSLNPAFPIALDLQEVQTAWSLARARISAPSLSEEERQEAIAVLKHAMTLVRGPFMEDFQIQDAAPFEDWMRVQREHWHLRVQEIFEHLTLLQEQAGIVAAALETALRWYAFDLLNEKAARHLMRLHDALGNRHAALQLYDDLVEHLQAELHARPDPETLALAQQLRTGTNAVTPTTNRATTIGAPVSWLRPPLVGRETEMGKLIKHYEQALTGYPQVVLLEGEAGIGKTRLVRDFTRWATAQGAEALSGRAFEVGGRLPYQPLIDAIRPRLDQENAPEDLLADVWLAELSRLLPELRERYPDLPFPTQDETQARPQLFEAIARLLQAWAARRPLLLWIDDVQWADTASLDLLLFLIEHSSQRHIPLLLVMNLRTEEIRPGTALGTWRHALTRSESVHRLPLSALSQQATILLLQAIQTATEAQAEPAESLEQIGDWFYRQTRGVPFYLLETLKELLEQRVLQVRNGLHETQGLDFRGLLAHIERGDIQVSTTIREVIRGRLEQFGPTSRAVLAAAAVLDQQSSFPALIAVTGLNEIEALTAIDEAMHSRVLVESKQGHGPASDSRYVFAHDLLREVVYQEAGEARKRVLHRRAFEQLQTYALPAAERARHARAAGLVTEEFHWSVRAGDEALTVYAMHDAIALYEQAQTLLANAADGQTFQEHCSLEQLEHLYLHIGRAYAMQNDWERTRTAYETLREIAHQRHDLLVEVRAINHLAVLAGLQASDFMTGKTRLHEALLLAQETGDLRTQAETEWNLAQIMMMQWKPEEALRHGERAIEMARAHGWKELLGRCVYVLAQTYSAGGNWELTLPLAQEGATFYEKQSDRGLEATEVSAQVIFAGVSPTQQMTNRAMEVACLCVVAITQVCLGNPQAGADVARKAVAISRASQNKWAEAFSLLQLNHALLDMAAYEEAFQVAQQALAITRVLQQPLLHFYILTINGASLNALGQYEQAYELLREADELIQQLHTPSWRVLSHSRLCINRAMMDDWEAAFDYAQESIQIRNELRSQLIFIDFYRHYEIEALIRAGKKESATRDIAQLARLVGKNRRYMLLLLRMQAVLAQANDHNDKAIIALEKTCRLAEELSLPGEQWQILATLAELYDHTGQWAQAQQTRTRATQIIQHLAEQITDDRLRTSFLAMTRLKRWSILSKQFL